MWYKFRKRKTVFLTIVSFTLTLFMVLNLMMVQISPEGRQHDLINSKDKIFYKQEIQGSKKSADFDDFHNYFVAQGQRKPKTTNLEKEMESDINVKDTYLFLSEKLDHTYYNSKESMREGVNTEVLNKLKIQNSEHEKIQSQNQDRSRHNPDVLTFQKQYLQQQNTKFQSIEEIEDLDKDNEDDEYDDNDDDDDDDYEYDDEYYYENKNAHTVNKPFKEGDFDDTYMYENFRKPKLHKEKVSNHLKHDQNVVRRLDSNKNAQRHIPNLVEDGIFWSPFVESLIPKGMSYRNITQLITSLRHQVVKTLEQPTWDKCGRPKNGYIVLGDNTRVCARYRQPHRAFVFGEVLSFYLSRLLGMDNVPAVVLAKTNTTSKQWRSVNISHLEWEDNKTIAFIQWIDHLNSGLRSKSYIPPLLLQAYRTGQPIRKVDIRRHHSQTNDLSFLVDLVQWGTMIIFDYLTGNYDRVASMQDAAEKEQNPHILEEAIRNLPKSAKDNKLWLIDNESGLLDAYHLLQSPKRSSVRFTNFHREMLQTTCVFQNSLVKALLKLSDHPSPHTRLLNFAKSHEPFMHEIPKDKYYKLFVSVFHSRLNDVKEWINQCKNYEKS